MKKVTYRKLLFEYNDKLNAPYECFIYDTGVETFPVLPHWHYFMEIIYMLEGTVGINCDEQNFIAEPEDMVLFLPHQIHSLYALSDSRAKYYVLKFDVGQLAPLAGDSSNLRSTIHFSAIFRAAVGNPASCLHFKKKDFIDFSAREIFVFCHNNMQKREYGYRLMMQSYITALLVFVLRFWRAHGFDTDQGFTKYDEKDAIYFITEYIDRHIQDSLKVEELADYCNMSYSYFAKAFKQLYGQSCKKYIEFIRLCKAEELLLCTNCDLNYISQETGFSDCSHFIKAFKSYYGITPKKYREKIMRYKKD